MNEITLRTREFKAKQNQQLFDNAYKLITNPAVLAIGGCALVELLQRVSIDEKPSVPGHWSWGLDIGWHSAKPAEDVRLFSDVLGSAIEAGLIINLAGGLEAVTSSGVSFLKGLSGLSGLIK